MVSVEVVEDKSGTIAADGGDCTSDSKTAGEKSCRVCGVGPCTTRCSLCKLVYYCSVDCQRTDWTKGGHRKKCTGKQKRQPKKRKNTNSTPIVMGPSIPPPTSVRTEDDAKRALQELWSIAESEMQEKTAETIGRKKSGETNPSSQQPTSEKDNSIQKTNQTTTSKPNSKTKRKTKPDSFSTRDDNNHPQKDELQSLSSKQQDENITFVVEEMPQICRFQLTLTKRLQHIINNNHFAINDSSISISAKAIGRSRTRTLVVIRQNTENDSGDILFSGEFPRPIHAADITWRVVDNDNQDESTIVFRLPYPYDPSNTSSLALGGSIDHSYCDSKTDATIDEINTVVCGTCHLPLIVSNASTKQQPKISRAFPLPQGHWDEIADYLICYDGQPVVDFSAGSECAEPSIALQDASLLCFHRKDVEQGVCALAVDGYGELSENDNDENKDIVSDPNNDLVDFMRPASSSFVLPAEDSGNATATEEKKDESTNANSNGEAEISATSAGVRGDRTWQDAVDGESVSLCCARCCSPLGFASLTSPETWRFWKHRLSIQVQAGKTTRRNDETKTQSNERHEKASDFAATMSFAMNTTIPETKTTKQPRMQITTMLPVTKPMASCSSFLARELVRYAESKAIFTFVVRREGVDAQKNECLLLRLLSWETAMATSYKDNSKNDKELLFRKVAKIVFEVTVDPTMTRDGILKNHGNNNGEAPTQWFWGGVDLCCPPSTSSSNNENVNVPTNQSDLPPDAVSTVRLQLPNNEYNSVLKDLASGKSLFEPEIANATILLKMGGLTKGLGLTAVAL